MSHLGMGRLLVPPDSFIDDWAVLLFRLMKLIKASLLALICSSLICATPKSPLHQAVIDGNLIEVSRLLNAGTDPNLFDDRGWTPLQRAAQAGNISLIDFLVCNGAKIDKEGSSFSNPLLTAVEAKQTTAILELLRLGAHIEYKDRNSGGTALCIAAMKSDWIGELLITSGAKMNSVFCNPIEHHDPLGVAISNHRNRLARFMIERGADFNQNHLNTAAGSGNADFIKWAMAKNLIGNEDINNSELLHWAAKGGLVWYGEYIIQQGASVNTTDPAETPLYWAACEGHIDFMKLLLRHGADVNGPGKTGNIPLMAAAECGTMDALNFLIAHGASLNMKNWDGWTPILWALKNRNEEIALRLLAAGTDIKGERGERILIEAAEVDEYRVAESVLQRRNDRGIFRNTVIHCAAAKASLNFIKLLIRHGADINLPDDNGQTAIFLALEFRREQNAIYLIRHGAKINIKDKEGRTPLMFALGHPWLDGSAALELIRRGANVKVRDNEGNTALHWAAANGMYGLIPVLIKKGVDVNSLNHSGETPLAKAYSSDDQKMTKFLKEHGARYK